VARGFLEENLGWHLVAPVLQQSANEVKSMPNIFYKASIFCLIRLPFIELGSNPWDLPLSQGDINFLPGKRLFDNSSA